MTEKIYLNETKYTYLLLYQYKQGLYECDRASSVFTGD